MRERGLAHPVGPRLRPWRIAALAAVAAAVSVSVPATSAPLPTRYLLVTVAPEAGQALPSVARVAAVTDALEAQGLAVTRGPGLLLEAHGRVAAPRLTGALATDVAGVVDSSASSIHWRPRADKYVTGNDLLQAYSVPSAPLTPVTPPTLTDNTPIVATIQLSGWNASDLSAYAKTQGPPPLQPPLPLYTDPTYDPVASGQYTAVATDRTSALTPDDAKTDGEFEVALDQETLLAVAPKLKQRAYFAQNQAGGATPGILGAYNAVLADVHNGYPIVALSTSWGACEDSSLGFASFSTSLDATLKSLNDAGVTVFAASGDAGSFDCSQGDQTLTPDNTQLAVDYPCSSQWVVCVGGTDHQDGSAAPAPDTAWDHPGNSGGVTNNFQGSGSGGGASAVFARPSWQDGVTTGAKRLVPDFALDGDPSTGIYAYVDGTPGAIGGTSLSSPTAAAMSSDIVAASYPSCAFPKGFGDIHPALYTHPSAFVDVVQPTTSTVIQPAAVGYDQSSGLGTPVWSALALALTDQLAPSVCVTSWKRASASNTKIGVTWTASDTSGLKATGVAVVSSNPHDGVFSKALPASARSFTFTGKPGRAYAVAVAAADNGGRFNANIATTDVTLPADDRAARLSKGWTKNANKNAYGSTVATSSTQGATAKLVVKGTTVGVLVDFGRANGRFALLIDGKVVKTVDTGGAPRWAVPITVKRTAGKHTVVIRVLGTHGHGSGPLVSLDGIIANA